MDKREKLIEATLVTLALAAVAAPGAQAAPKKGAKSIECFGVNTSKGTNGCAIGSAQIEAANKSYSNKFTKSKPVDCAGTSDCSAKNGFLGWVAKASEGECFGAGGFVIEAAGGKFTVRDKAPAKG